MSKQFHTGTVLSIIGKALLSPEGIGGVYEILDYMMSTRLFTHQLPAAADFCRPYLIKQLPQLADYDDKGINTENWQEWLEKQIELYGEYLEVCPLADPKLNLAEHEKTFIALDVDAWNRRHSLTDADVYLELVEHVGGKKAAVMMARPNECGKE